VVEHCKPEILSSITLYLREEGKYFSRSQGAWGIKVCMYYVSLFYNKIRNKGKIVSAGY
jgi:hypothetical protein